MMQQSSYLLCCPCHFGLERTLRFEISKIGGTDIAAQDGRVLFRGNAETIAKANLCLSTAERVLIQLGQFKAYNFEELFQGIRSLPLEQWIGKDDAFPVKDMLWTPSCTVCRTASLSSKKQLWNG